MIINCNFIRIIRTPGGRVRKYENRSKTGIEVPGDWEKDDHEDIRKELMKYAPPGDGWRISGYCLVQP